jgi:hypothetical protein
MEIALGIVLAVIILRLLPAIVAVAMVVGVIALIAITALLIWLNFQTIAVYVGALGAVGVMYGIPFELKAKIEKRYPPFAALIRGEPPYNQMARQPLRIAVMACFSVAVAAVGVGALLGAISAIDLISQAVGK